MALRTLQKKTSKTNKDRQKVETSLSLVVGRGFVFTTGGPWRLLARLTSALRCARCCCYCHLHLAWSDATAPVSSPTLANSFGLLPMFVNMSIP